MILPDRLTALEEYFRSGSASDISWQDSRKADTAPLPKVRLACRALPMSSDIGPGAQGLGCDGFAKGGEVLHDCIPFGPSLDCSFAG